jgi:uncharacterized membrane protein
MRIPEHAIKARSRHICSARSQEAPGVAFAEFILLIEKAFQLAGVLVLIVGACIAAIWFVVAAIRHVRAPTPYEGLRQGLGRAILVGLEFLVAADIIRSVAVDPTFQSVGVLGLIVLIRTFLSWSLEVEITGAWPWRRTPSRSPAEIGPPDPSSRSPGP